MERVDRLRVHVAMARGLHSKGGIDPYAVLSLKRPGQETWVEQQRTKVQRRTDNPSFDEWIEVSDQNLQGSLCRVQLWDHNQLLRDGFLGECFFSVAGHENEEVRTWHPLMKRSNRDEVSGDVLLGITFLSPKREMQPIHSAVYRGDLATVQQLVLEDPERCNVPDDSPLGWAPLHYAASFGHLDIARFLVMCGADVNLRALSQATPLLECARSAIEGERRFEEIAHLLLSQGADATMVTSNGNTPLHYAIRNGLVDLARTFLHHNPECATAPNSEGKTPLMLVSRIRDPVKQMKMAAVVQNTFFFGSDSVSMSLSVHSSSTDAAERAAPEALAGEEPEDRKLMSELGGRLPSMVEMPVPKSLEEALEQEVDALDAAKAEVGKAAEAAGGVEREASSSSRLPAFVISSAECDSADSVDEFIDIPSDVVLIDDEHDEEAKAAEAEEAAELARKKKARPPVPPRRRTTISAMQTSSDPGTQQKSKSRGTGLRHTVTADERRDRMIVENTGKISSTVARIESLGTGTSRELEENTLTFMDVIQERIAKGIDCSVCIRFFLQVADKEEGRMVMRKTGMLLLLMNIVKTQPTLRQAAGQVLALFFNAAEADYYSQFKAANILTTLCALAINEEICLHPTVILEELEFGDLIGSGANGKVYKGTYRGMAVAIKEMRETNLMPSLRSDLFKELSLLCLVKGPFIPVFVGAHLDFVKERVVLVSELASDGSLESYLEKFQGDLTIPQIYRIAWGLAKAVQFVHEFGITHRDLKPANFLVHNGNILVTDLGESRFISPEHGELRECVGSPIYMAPELFDVRQTNVPYTTSVDIYSLGLMFWQLASKQLPYQNMDMLSLAENLKGGERPQMPEWLDESCPAFATLIREMWDGKPELRPSITETVNRLQLLLLHQGVEVPVSIVNLSDPPSTRWNSVIASHRPQLDRAKQHVESILGQLEPKLQEKIHAMARRKSSPFQKEMAAIGKQIDWSIDLVYMFQLIVEHHCSGCVSIIFDSRDSPWHCFTADFRDLPWLRELAVKVTFMKNNNLEMVAATFVGYVGALALLVPGQIGITYCVSEQLEEVFASTVSRIVEGIPPVGITIRAQVEDHFNAGGFTDQRSFSLNDQTFERAPRACAVVCSSVKKLDNRMVMLDHRGVIYLKKTGNAMSTSYSIREPRDLVRFQEAIEEFLSFQFDRPRPLLLDLRRLLHKHPIINTESVFELIMSPRHWVMDMHIVQTTVDPGERDVLVSHLAERRREVSVHRFLRPAQEGVPAVLWVDPKPQSDENQHFVHAASSIGGVVVAQAISQAAARQWLHDYRDVLLALQEDGLFRVITNRYRHEDGGEDAPKNLIHMLRKLGFTKTHVLVYTRQLTAEVQELIADPLVVATEMMLEAIHFSTMRPLEEKERRKRGRSFLRPFG